MKKTQKLTIEAIKSPIIQRGDDVGEILTDLLKKKKIRDGDILVVASKVVAVAQGRIMKIENSEAFDDLVKKEADEVIGGEQVTLTIKENIFIPWAGIDRSNIQKGYAVLWPQNPSKVAEDLRESIQKTFKLKKLGIIITDSWCLPLRKGVSGITLGYSGFQGVNDLRGQKDLHGNPLKVTQQAMADNLSTAAHLVMGESDDRTPFVLIRNAPVVFTNKKQNPHELSMKKEECLFSPLYKIFR